MAGYGSDEDFEAWLDAQGLTLPEDPPALAALRQRGSDYVDATYEMKLQCSNRTDPIDQERAWPRTGHMLRGQAIASDAIPSGWVKASYRAAWLEATNPGWATNSVDPNRRTKREKADVLEREFFAASAEGATGILGNVDAVINGMVSPLFCCRNAFLQVI